MHDPPEHLSGQPGLPPAPAAGGEASPATRQGPQQEQGSDSQAEAGEPLGPGGVAPDEPGGDEPNALIPSEQDESLVRVAVVALSGPEDGKVSLLIGGGGVIGRHSPHLAVELPRDPRVSRRHAELRYHDGHWWITDLGSSNGTLLGDQRQLTPQVEEVIEVGQVFRVGHTDLMLSEDPTLIAQAVVQM